MVFGYINMIHDIIFFLDYEKGDDVSVFEVF